MKLTVNFSLIILCVFSISGCRYSLSGYELGNAKTAKVVYFENQAPIQSAELSQIFSSKLEQTLLRETQLQLTNNDSPDVQFSGAIIGYALSPVAIRDVEQTEETQLTVTINVDYVNYTDDSKSFKQTFSGSETFNANLDLSSVESELLDDITDQIVLAIFNKAFIDW